MASSSAPDPRSFTTWSQAFDYPIPTTRQLERRLRADAATSSSKLRDLVGSSYRDLLDTANAIVEIHGQSEQVERLLRKIGSRLDVRGIERGSRNINGWRHARDDTDGRLSRLRRAAMLSLLRGTVTYVAGVVRGELGQEGVLLTAAKVLIVGRLVEKALSDDTAAATDKETKSVVLLGKRLAAERSKLLGVIDRRLASIKTSESADNASVLVKNLTAFALATRSTPSQVLHHFQTVRLDAIRKEATKPSKTTLVKRLQLFLRTLRDCKAIFADLMAASLKSLAAGPLLQDPSIASLEHLSLDVNGLWIDQDVRNFTPWTRHDELAKQKAEDMQKSWAKHALTILATSVAADLNGLDDIQAVVDARKKFLQIWLSNRQYARHIDAKVALDQLRIPFRTRVIALLSKRFSDLDSAVRESMADILSRPANIDSPESLWSSSMTYQEIDRGATSFKSSIISARKGHIPFITAFLGRFDEAADSIAQAQTLVKQMRDTRWDDDYDDYDSSSSETDAAATPSSSSAQEALGKTDPQAVQDALAEATTETYAALDTFFAAQVTGTGNDGAKASSLKLACDAPNATGVVVLRVLNELRARAPPSVVDTFVLQSSQLLRSAVAEHIAARTAPILTTALTRAYVSANTGQGKKQDVKPFTLALLWDNGEPALPMQPSPAPLRVLKFVVREMESLGIDIWGAKEGVRDLKTRITSLVQTEAAKYVDSIAEETFEIPSSGAADAAKPAEGQEAATEENAKVGNGDDGSNTSKTEDAENAPAEDTANGGGDGDGAKAEDKPADGSVDDPPSNDSAAQEAQHAEQKQQKLTQLLFDLLYLQRALAVPAASDSSQPAIVPATLLDALAFAKAKGTSESEEMTRLRKAAQEYWKRTYLLFGLLA